MRRAVPAGGVQGLSYYLAVGRNLEFVTDGKRSLESVVLYSDPTALCRDYSSGSLKDSQSCPALKIDRPPVSLANEVVSIKGYYGLRGILVNVILDEFRN